MYLGLQSVGTEDVGVICAIHHLAAGFLVLVTPTAVGALSLPSMAICRHSVTGVAHGASLIIMLLCVRAGGGNKQGNYFFR